MKLYEVNMKLIHLKIFMIFFLFFRLLAIDITKNYKPIVSI